MTMMEGNESIEATGEKYILNFEAVDLQYGF